MKLFKKILYGIRIITNILYLVLFIYMLPYIYNASWQGILFLGTTFLYIGMTLWTLLSKKKVYQETISYNLIMICVFCYFTLITVRILIDPRLESNLYVLNMEYCRNNFFLLSLILIGVILNTILLALATEEETRKIQKER